MPVLDSLDDTTRSALEALGITNAEGLASARPAVLLTLPGMDRPGAERLIAAARAEVEPEDETSRGTLPPDSAAD